MCLKRSDGRKAPFARLQRHLNLFDFQWTVVLGNDLLDQP